MEGVLELSLQKFKKRKAEGCYDEAALAARKCVEYIAYDISVRRLGLPPGNVGGTAELINTLYSKKCISSRSKYNLQRIRSLCNPALHTGQIYKRDAEEIERLLVEEVDKYAAAYGGNVSPELKSEAKERIAARRAAREQSVAMSKKQVRINWVVSIAAILLIILATALYLKINI